MKIANIVSLILFQCYVIVTSISRQADLDPAGTRLATRSLQNYSYSESKCILDDRADNRVERQAEKRDINFHSRLQIRDKNVHSFTSAELKGILEEYSKRLYNYMWANKFCFIRFENSAPRLEMELRDIDWHVNSSNPNSKDISEHHENVHRMFGTMADNIENMRLFKSRNSKEYRWLWRTLEIRILLFTVHTTYGDPKLTVEKRLDRIDCYKDSLRFFKHEMDTTPGISYGVRWLFHSYHREAQRLIQA